MAYKNFNIWFLALVFGALMSAALLAVFRIGGGDNDLILRYQLSKLNDFSRQKEKLDFAILGDSSAGNSVSVEELERLSGRKSGNFALTGSYGVLGSLYFMRQLHERLGVKQFFLIHSVDVWHRDLRKEAIFKLRPLGSLNEYDKFVQGRIHWEFLKYLLNPQRLANRVEYFVRYTLSYIRGARMLGEIENDFLAQRHETFANGAKRLETPMQWEPLSAHKLQELQLVKQYCVSKRIKCVLMSGPVHESAYNLLQERLEQAFEDLDSKDGYFILDLSVPMLPATKMGDTLDHVDRHWKAFSTRIFWKQITKYFVDLNMDLQTRKNL